MIPVRASPSPNHSKEVKDRVAVFPVAFGVLVGFCIESCCGLPCFLQVLAYTVLTNNEVFCLQGNKASS